MSLATRCTSCGTIFRVVQDQLRVSEGWVRCGRCDAVFQATESLFDLERDPAPPWPAPAAASGVDPVPPSMPSPEPMPDAPAASSAADGAAREPDPSEPPASAEAALRALSAAAAAGDTDADAIVVRPERPAAAAATRPVRAPVEASPPVEAPPPAFVEQARRDAFWQRRPVRALLSGAALILIFTLLLQATQQFSDIAAARWPAVRPALAPWCRWTGCSLAAPRRIDEILVESTSLTPAPGTGALQLAVGLRNRAGYAVALPSVDLSLTDTTGRLIARRSLQPRDFRVAVADLASRAELPLRALVTAGNERVSGYTVEIFYP